MKILWMFAALLLVPTLAWSEGTLVNQATCAGNWTAPQTNTDGSNLADLKEYGIYVATTAVAVAAPTAPTAVLAAAVLDPPTGQTVAWNGCRQLAIGQWYAQIDAVDTSGNRSARTPIVPFVLADAVSPQAPGTPTFGP